MRARISSSLTRAAAFDAEAIAGGHLLSVRNPVALTLDGGEVTLNFTDGDVLTSAICHHGPARANLS